MTRKRTRESLIQTLCTPCFYCEGKGYIKSKETIAYEIFRELLKTQGDIQAKEIELYVHSDIARVIQQEAQETLQKLEKQVNKPISIHVQKDFHLEQFELKSKS